MVASPAKRLQRLSVIAAVIGSTAWVSTSQRRKRRIPVAAALRKVFYAAVDAAESAHRKAKEDREAGDPAQEQHLASGHVSLHSPQIVGQSVITY
jgi:hypothetical protein